MTVDAVEPSNSFFKILKLNIPMKSPSIRLHNFALGIDNSEAILHLGTRNATGTLDETLIYGEKKIKLEKIISKKAESFFEIISKKIPDSKKILYKSDTDGADFNILEKYFFSRLWKQTKILYIEVPTIKVLTQSQIQLISSIIKNSLKCILLKKTIEILDKNEIIFKLKKQNLQNSTLIIQI